MISNISKAGFKRPVGHSKKRMAHFFNINYFFKIFFIIPEIESPLRLNFNVTSFVLYSSGLKLNSKPLFFSVIPPNPDQLLLFQ